MNEQENAQTRSDTIVLPHQRFDIVAKDPFYTYPEDMLQFLMGNKDFEFIEHVDTNLTNVDVRQMDILVKVLIDEQPALIHCEIQTDDSVNPNMVQRNVGYLGRCFEKYGLPIYSYVLSFNVLLSNPHALVCGMWTANWFIYEKNLTFCEKHDGLFRPFQWWLFMQPPHHRNGKWVLHRNGSLCESPINMSCLIKATTFSSAT